jgi:dTDP-4-dehydrorhamnose 3,5-epimerase
MPFQFRPLEIPEVILVEPRVFKDPRGFFVETYKASDFEQAGIVGPFRQDNHSRSTQRGVLRGLHHQLEPAAQGKLVRCLKGAIFDVAVDIRRGSKTFGKWVGAEITEENQRLLWIPPGFAHGFCTVTEICDVLYKCTAEYSPEHERSIRWDDPDLKIRWPVEVPLLSDKDARAPLFKDAT